MILIIYYYYFLNKEKEVNESQILKIPNFTTKNIVYAGILHIQMTASIFFLHSVGGKTGKKSI